MINKSSLKNLASNPKSSYKISYEDNGLENKKYQSNELQLKVSAIDSKKIKGINKSTLSLPKIKTDISNFSMIPKSSRNLTNRSKEKDKFQETLNLKSVAKFMMKRPIIKEISEFTLNFNPKSGNSNGKTISKSSIEKNNSRKCSQSVNQFKITENIEKNIKNQEKNRILKKNVNDIENDLKISKKPTVFGSTSKMFLRKSMPFIENPSSSPRITEIQSNRLCYSSDSSSELDSPEITRIRSCILEISTSLFTSFLDNYLYCIAESSYSEVILASLILFSNSIMDKYLTETLSIEVPNLITQVYLEYKEIAYLDSQSKIIDEVYLEELIKIVNFTNANRISCEILNGLLENIDLQEDLIKVSIEDEENENKTMVIEIVSDLFEEFLNEDWLPIAIEDELSTQKIEKIWEYFPQQMQKDYNTVHHKYIIDKIVDYIYFDYLNDVVGGIWLESLIKTVLIDEKNENIETLMPIFRVQRKSRSYTYLHRFMR